MAQRIEILLTDDLDGTDAVETLRFGVGSDAYEIDLNESNAQRLRDALAPFTAAARKVPGARSVKPAGRTASTTRAARQWAAENGIDVNPRGRVSETVMRQYTAAQS